MCRKFVCLMSLVMVVGLAGSVNAGVLVSQATGDWSVAANWYDVILEQPATAPPGPGDTAYVMDGFTITSTGTEEVAILVLGEAETTGTLNVNAGSVTATSYMLSGGLGGAGTFGTLNVNSASITVGATGLWAGWNAPGTINMSNATVDVSTGSFIVGAQGFDGDAYLSDTTMNTHQLLIAQLSTAGTTNHLEVSGNTVINTCHFNIGQGAGAGTVGTIAVLDDAQIIIDETYGPAEDYAAAVQGFIDLGWINGSVAVVGDTAVISVIPEPATLLLLGLGGLLIRRRRA